MYVTLLSLALNKRGIMGEGGYVTLLSLALNMRVVKGKGVTSRCCTWNSK